MLGGVGVAVYLRKKKEEVATMRNTKYHNSPPADIPGGTSECLPGSPQK